MDWRYFISGTIAGGVQTIIGHPLDTLKTISQNKVVTPSYSFKLLYSGFLPAVIQSSFLTGSSFYVNNYFYDLTKSNFLSSLYTGIIGSLFICPLEQLKIRQQTNSCLNISLNSPFNYYRFLYLVFLRETPAITVYFSSYRYFKDNQINVILSGGISGCLSWLITYPVDTIKSRVQSGLCSTVRESINKGNLYSGLNFCLIRAFLVNSISFFTYEKIMSKLI